MKPTLQLFAPCTDSSVCCPVAGFGIVRGTPDMIAGLRRNPVPSPGEPLFSSFLRHADEQTVAGVAAVYQTIHNHGLAGTDFTWWAILGAPRFLGRAAMVQSLQRFSVEGAWGISPHLIPHHSQHAVSGTISQALKIHGPNLGIGGGAGTAVEALILAATLLSAGALPGLWLVLTDYEPELVPVRASSPATNGTGHAGHDSLCVALALALVPDITASMGITLRVCAQAETGLDAPAGDWTSWQPFARVSSLIAALSQNGLPEGKWRLGSTGWMELTCTDVGTENGR